jgi:hypothetical protein
MQIYAPNVYILDVLKTKLCASHDSWDLVLIFENITKWVSG